MKYRKKEKKKKQEKKVILWIGLLTFFLGIFFNLLSNSVMGKANVFFSFVLVLFIIFVGIFFDALGVAVATASEKPFHSMASNKIIGTKESIYIIRNASVFATIFNDVIGDICGIVSGAGTAAIVLKLINRYDLNSIILSILLGSLAAALTVVGKAIGKEIAMNHSEGLVYKIGLVMYRFNIRK